MDLTDEQWTIVEPLIPKPKVRADGRGRPWCDDRQVLNGILWILRTGAPWDDLPRRYGKRGTVSSRYYRWRQAGIWERSFADLQAQADADNNLDWTIHFVDSTVIRAHQHAAGAKRSDPDSEALGRSQGGFSTKLNVRAAGQGKPMTFVLQPGQAHESQAFEPLMERASVRRPWRGRPRRRPRRVARLRN